MRIPQRVRQIELPQFDVLKEIAGQWQARGKDVIGLGAALPGFDPPIVAREAFRDALENGSSHIYSADAGIMELRQALATSFDSLGAKVDPVRELIITAGGNQAFHTALTTLIDPGDEVVLVSPYFLNHAMTVQAIGATVVEVPIEAERGFVPSWRDLQAHLSERTAAVVVVSPSNPTGAVVDPPTLQEIVDECASRNIIVVIDETYLRFTYDVEPFPAARLINWRENVVIVGSFSKGFAITGWRCGYLLAEGSVIDEAMKVHDCMVICAPVPVQHAVAAVLREEPDYARRWLPELRARRDVLSQRLAAIAGVSVKTPTGGFFVFAKFAAMRNSEAAAMDLINEQQVITIPGRYFGRAGEGHLRISYGAATRQRLEEACDRIALWRTAAPATAFVT